MITALNNINQLVFLMETRVLFAVGTDSLNAVYMSFNFKVISP
jgi:hypothetical protein